MSELFSTIRTWLADDQLVTTAIILLVAIASFGFGRLSVVPAANTAAISARISRESVPKIPETLAITEISKDVEATVGEYVASRNGSKYHRISCPGVKQMSEQNKIYFTSVTEAEAAGYQPAANCKF